MKSFTELLDILKAYFWPEEDSQDEFSAMWIDIGGEG